MSDNVIDFEMVEGAVVFAHRDGAWQPAVVVDFDGADAKLRHAGIEFWASMDEVKIQDPGAANTKGEPFAYVTVYAVTRHYGGPQEGGWWWNRYERVSYLPLREPGSKEELKRLREVLTSQFTDEGNIYSMRGGVEYHVLNEVALGESEILTSGGWS